MHSVDRFPRKVLPVSLSKFYIMSMYYLWKTNIKRKTQVSKSAESRKRDWRAGHFCFVLIMKAKLLYLFHLIKYANLLISGQGREGSKCWEVYGSFMIRVFCKSSKHPGKFSGTLGCFYPLLPNLPVTCTALADRDYFFPKENLRKSSFQNSTT